LTDRERTEKLAERLSKRDDEIYRGRRFDAGLSHRSNSDHLSHGVQGPTPAVDPTSDQRETEKSLPAEFAMWNMKIQRVSTVSTVGGGECHPLFFHHETSFLHEPRDCDFNSMEIPPLYV